MTVRCKKAIHDISMPLNGRTPVWPGSDGFRIRWLKCLERDGCNESAFSIGSHTGTHVDFPFHFLENGAKAAQIRLEPLLGDAFVLDCRNAASVGPDLLEQAAIPCRCRRLLLKTRNSFLDGPDFVDNYVGLTPEGASWLVRQEVALVGIDYLSIEPFGGGGRTHRTLLQGGVVILEGLRLGEVSQGAYQLVALPLNIPELEGVPARALLLEGDEL